LDMVTPKDSQAIKYYLVLMTLFCDHKINMSIPKAEILSTTSLIR
jgi:hypothetical protein